MATTSNAATRPLRPAKLPNLFLRGALARLSPWRIDNSAWQASYIIEASANF
jgi:hypothetical protein